MRDPNPMRGAIFCFIPLTSSLLFSAPPPADGRVLVLNVDGQSLLVNLNAKAPRYLLDPRNGDRLVSFTAEEATLIAEALDLHGLQHRTFDVLLGLQYPREDGETNLASRPSGLRNSTDPAPDSLSQREFRLHLRVGATDHQFDLLGGGPSHALDPETGDLVMRFSVPDANHLAESLQKEGYSTREIMRVLFGLHKNPSPLAYPNKTIAEPSRVKKPLDPPCNTCVEGELCCFPEASKSSCTCCSGGTGCVVCKTC
jgi:hypothetical protein